MVSMKIMPTEQRVRVLACLVEGNSIRATCRMTGAGGCLIQVTVDWIGLGDVVTGCWAFTAGSLRRYSAPRWDRLLSALLPNLPTKCTVPPPQFGTAESAG